MDQESSLLRGFRSLSNSPIILFRHTGFVMDSKIPIDSPRLATFCRRWRIKELSLFGSALGPNLGEDSDIDLLVTYQPDARWTLFDESAMEDELSEILGRKVDLVSRRAVERSPNHIRRQAILKSARPIHVEG